MELLLTTLAQPLFPIFFGVAVASNTAAYRRTVSKQSSLKYTFVHFAFSLPN